MTGEEGRGVESAMNTEEQFILVFNIFTEDL